MKQVLRWLGLVVLVVAGWLYGVDGPADSGSGQATVTIKPAQAGGSDEIEQAFRTQRSDVAVEFSARVAKVLPDDNDGSRHQRFLVRLSNQRSLLIAHNIDLAPRVPLARDDEIEIKGEYEWNEQGGVVHWTHLDPARRHADGWIRHADKLYQ